MVGLAIVIEASSPKAYHRVTVASASNLSGSLVRALRGGEGLPKMFCLVVSNLRHLRNQVSIVCGSSLQRVFTQWVCGGVEEIGVGLQQRCVTGSKARKENRICTLLMALQS